MSELIVPGTITSESEFQNGLTGACGPNAVASAARWAMQSASYNTVSMTQALQWVVASPNGVSTLAELRALAVHIGLHVVDIGTGETPLAFCQRLAGHAAIIAFYTNGQALIDYHTGLGEDANHLEGHFNCIFGRNTGGVSSQFGGTDVPPGFIVSDGDNRVVNPTDASGNIVHMGLNRRMVYYPDTTMQAAQLAGAFAILSQSGGLVNMAITLDMSPVNHYFAQSPTISNGGHDWLRCISGVASAPILDEYGKPIIIKFGALLDFYTTYGKDAYCGLTYLGLPIANEGLDGVTGVTFQQFERGCLVYDPAHHMDSPPGTYGGVYLGHLNNGVIQSLYAQPLLRQANATIAALSSEVGSVKTDTASIQAAVTSITALAAQLTKLANILQAATS